MSLKKIASSAVTNAVSDETILNKVYDDIAHPAAQNVGQAIDTLTSTLNVLLAPISWAVYGFNIIDVTVKSKLKEKLSNTPLENLKEPDPNIVIPAYEALRYSLDKDELCEMYTKLISASMIKDNKNIVHPAFVEIIKQLYPFDAVLLKKISDTKENILGIIKTRLIKSPIDDQGLDWIKHIIDPSFGMNLSNITQYQVSLENLQRLQLLTISYDKFLVDDSEYTGAENGEICTYCKDRAPHMHDVYKTFKTKHGQLQITSFGKEFISTCII